MHALRTPLTVLTLSLAVAGMAHAQTPDKIKIGFITDMSSNYADVDGKNGAVAIQMAIDDFGGKALGQPKGDDRSGGSSHICGRCRNEQRNA